MYLWDYARRKRVVVDTMFTILLILTWGLKYPQIRREAEKGDVEISCRACLLFPCYFGYKKKLLKALFSFITWLLRCVKRWTLRAHYIPYISGNENFLCFLKESCFLYLNKQKPQKSSLYFRKRKPWKKLQVWKIKKPTLKNFIYFWNWTLETSYFSERTSKAPKLIFFLFLQKKLWIIFF